MPAAFWRKYRIGEIDAEHARVLTAEFEADYFGTIEELPRFAVVAVTDGVLDETARLCGRFPLRAHDAVQLGCALPARAADPGLSAMAVFDTALRNAAAAEGLAVSP